MNVTLSETWKTGFGASQPILYIEDPVVTITEFMNPRHAYYFYQLPLV